MLNIISTGSNYIFMIMCAIYALSCFTVFLPSTEEQQIKRMNRQERFMFIFHFICYGVLFLKTFDVRILILYVAQAVFFKFLIFLYEHLYMDCSRILMNHTCFLLIIGFVMLTRLDFAEALKQFAIVAVCSFVVLAVPFIMEKAYWLKRLRWIYGLIGLLLLASVFVIGTTKNGSTNWISLGPVALQPSEFVKIAFIFFLAAMLEKPVSFPRVFVTALFSACHVLVLILERDLGGALLSFCVTPPPEGAFMSSAAWRQVLWREGLPTYCLRMSAPDLMPGATRGRSLRAEVIRSRSLFLRSGPADGLVWDSPRAGRPIFPWWRVTLFSPPSRKSSASFSRSA